MQGKSDKEGRPAASVLVTFVLEDPESLTGDPARHEVQVEAAVGDALLQVALEAGINVEHACGGVCACSTCHIYVEAGEHMLSAAEDDELDRVEEAPGLQINSRLACQAVIRQPGAIRVRVPAWNRNAVKETPH